MKITRNITDVFPDKKPHKVDILSGEKEVAAVFKKDLVDKVSEPFPNEEGPNLAWHVNFRGKEFGVMIFGENDVDLEAASKKVEALIEILLINAGQSIERLREKETTCLQ